MDVLLKKLTGLLEGEIELLESLLMILQEEKGAMLDSNMDTLNQARKEKENLILKIRILEEQRMHLMERIADSFQSPDRFLTLAKLSQMVENSYSERLDRCRSSIRALTQSIDDLNNTNRGLIKHSLDLIRGSLSLFDKLTVPHPTYYRTGEIMRKNQTGKVLSGMV